MKAFLLCVAADAVQITYCQGGGSSSGCLTNIYNRSEGLVTFLFSSSLEIFQFLSQKASGVRAHPIPPRDPKPSKSHHGTRRADRWRPSPRALVI